MQEVKFQFDLGQVVDHEITGYCGTVMGQAHYYSGCLQYLVKPRMTEEDTKNNKMPDGEWIDENQLVLAQMPQASADPQETVGGPQHHPPVS